MSAPMDLEAELRHLDDLAAAECSWRQAVKRFAAARGLVLEMGNVERAVQAIYDEAEAAR